VAALITPGSQITLRGVGLNPTRTGLLEALVAMGGDVQVANRSQQGGEPMGDLIVSYSRLDGVQVDGNLVVRMIDEFPAFAVAAAFAQGRTVVSEASELRYKESDRIGALCAELGALGVQVSEKEDGFVIQGGRPPKGGAVDPHGDHRLAMSLAVAGLATEEGVSVREARIIHESFPEFASVLEYLGAVVRGED
jgi:3-phosphoshikimate 1-carboxyvinyltransferase